MNRDRDRIMEILDKFYVDVRLSALDYAQLVVELDDICNERRLEIKKGWHDVVVECERILGLEGTAETPIQSNLPNALRDLLIFEDEEGKK